MELNQPFLLRSKVLSITRLEDAATGTVAYTGVGFRPRVMICLSSSTDNVLVTWGVVDEDLLNRGIARALAATPAFDIISPVGSMASEQTSANVQTGNVISFDADGFTIQWVKYGTPAGNTLRVICLCLG